MPNPVDILERARIRIARVSALRSAAYAVVPAIAAVVLAFLIDPIVAATWSRFGYVLSPARAGAIQAALFAIAAAAVVAGIVLAVRAWRSAGDFVAAAERVDSAVGGRQQILTFAALANPRLGDSAKESRSPLFPLLWRRAINLLERFDIAGAFPFGLVRPLARSSLIASAIVIAMLIATMGLVRAPTKDEIEATRLREIAAEIEKSGPDAFDRALAAEARSAADALENPRLAPEKKAERLEALMRDIERVQNNGTGASAKGAGSGKGTAEASGTSAAKGEGNGKGTGNGSGGIGKSNTPGSGAGNSRQGMNNGSNQNGGKKGQNNAIDLQNEVAKAEAQVETEGSNKPNPSVTRPDDNGKTGSAPKAGANPSAKGPPNEPNPNQLGNIPHQGARASKNTPQTGGNANSPRDQGSNQGDTHFGEIPTAAKFQHYLNPGQKGAALNIHDARYVMFRLPSATPIGNGGTTVLDNSHPTATTPYVNAPLKETSENAPPDERQMVPPRYRDLIR